ncbi:MAG: MFS transporter [Promethearchaeota archaeon]
MINQDNVDRTTEAPFKKYVFFGMPRIAASIVLTVIDFAIIFLYIEGYGKDFKIFPLLAGIATMCGKFAIAISQFLMGYLSDTTKSQKFGKRKPFMIISAPILAFSFTFLLLPTIFLGKNPDIVVLFLWLLIFDVLFQFFYGSLTTPYQSWMAEQFEVHERPTASAWQNIFNYVGTGIAILFIYNIVPKVMADFAETKVINPLYSFTVIIFALTIVGLFYFSAFSLPVESAPPIEMNLMEDLKGILRDKNYLHVCVMVGIASLTWSMITGIMLGYVEFVLVLEDPMYATAALAVGVVFSLFIWKKIIDKAGKKKSLTIIFIWAIISIPFAGILPLFPFEDFTIPAIILVMIVSASLGGWFLFPYIVYADMAENEQKNRKKDEMKAGLYTGFPSILLNIFQAFGYLLIGIILLAPPLPGKNYSLGYLIWAPIGSIILIIALIYLKKYIILDFDWEEKSD